LTKKISIINYGMGNIGSVVKKIQKIGFEPIVVQKKEDLLQATKIILPGVGNFAKAMQNLKELDLLETLNKKVIEQKTPILGICLGMQIMAQHSEEGNAKGLGWFDADVALFKNVDLEPGFYFVHAFHIQCNQTQDVLNTTTYEYPFTSAIQRDNIIGLQYHPEKSHDAGEQILLNFCENHF
jgi:glutamine amidotransferase